ncbi:MAG: ABC transporter substrate-binding protein [Flavonifractor plautii]
MKRLASLLLASALALTAADCAGQNPAASTQSGPPEAVESGKSSVAYVEELRIGTTAAIDGANVMTENGIFGKLNYNAVVTAPFVVTDENGKVQPFFMTGWELSGDLNTITATFATDQGLTWHDGEPVTMDDVVFTFQYLIDRKSSYCSGLTGVEAVNETTATLTLTDGKAFTMLNSMANFVTLRPEHVWSKVEGEYAEYTGEDAAIGCGPYKLTGVDEEAQSMTLEAVSDTYMGQELTVRKLTVRTYDSHDALVMALRSGEVDAMYDYSNSLNATMVDSITGVEGLDPGMSDNPGNYQLVFGFNEQPTDDLIFRKAVRAALDYESLRVTIGGEDGQIPHAGIVAPPIRALTARCPSWLRTWTKPTPCWMRAVMWMLTATAGGICPTASELNVLITPQYNKTRQALYLRIAEVLKTNLEAVGVQTTMDEESVRNSDHATEVRKQGTYELYIGYTSPGVAMYDTAFMYMIGDNDNNRWGTCLLPEFVAAYEAKKTVSSYEAYNAAMKELQALADEQVVGLALCWDKAYFPYRTDHYEGWTNFPGWGVINYKTWFSTRPAV